MRVLPKEGGSSYAARLFGHDHNDRDVDVEPVPGPDLGVVLLQDLAITSHCQVRARKGI